MTRHRAHLTGLAAALMVALTACGGGNPSAKKPATPSASPSASATTSTAPSPTGPPPQPKGKYGVTVDILNWDKYATDPALRAWKRTWEMMQASANHKKLVAGVVNRLSGDARRMVIANFQYVMRENYHVSRRMPVRVVGSHQGTVTACFWMPGYDFRTKDGKLYKGPENYWGRYRSQMKKTGGGWKMTSIKSTGKCPGGAPR